MKENQNINKRDSIRDVSALPQHDKVDGHSKLCSSEESTLFCHSEALAEESQNTNIPKGYKHTTLGILPQEWEVVRLGEVMDFLKTYQNPRSDLNDYDNIHYVHYGEIHTKYQYFIDFNKAVLPKINQNKLKTPLSLLQNGDVIVVDASEDTIDIAKSVEIQNLDSVIAEYPNCHCEEAKRPKQSNQMDCHEAKASRNGIQALRFKEFSGTWQEVKWGIY